MGSQHSRVQGASLPHAEHEKPCVRPTSRAKAAHAIIILSIETGKHARTQDGQQYARRCQQWSAHQLCRSRHLRQVWTISLRRQPCHWHGFMKSRIMWWIRIWVDKCLKRQRMHMVVQLNRCKNSRRMEHSVQRSEDQLREKNVRPQAVVEFRVPNSNIRAKSIDAHIDAVPEKLARISCNKG